MAVSQRESGRARRAQPIDEQITARLQRESFIRESFRAGADMDSRRYRMISFGLQEVAQRTRTNGAIRYDAAVGVGLW